jgi:RNA polymerase sigma-70 factor, ECF subfamily
MPQQDKNTFISLYEPIHLQFYRYCRAISGNPDDTEDLIQDTILNVLQGFDRIRDMSAFKSYLFGVAGNLHKMKLRKQRLKVGLSEEEVRQIACESQNPEYLADFALIYDKMLMLPHRMAETLILFHISDLSLDEIQRIQGGSLSGVEQRLKRGREKLLSILNSKEQVKLKQMLLTF